MKIKTLIIDDEALARALVKNFIADDTDFEVIAEAADGFEALKLIQDLQPDLIILDIQMPKITGLEMLELLDKPPAVIFCTAYDQYAIEAFDKNAIDYLLKPFSRERFIKALAKIKINIKDKAIENSTIVALQNAMPVADKNVDRLVVKNGNKIEVIGIENVVFVESYGDYVWIHTHDAKYIKQQTMKDLETQLSDSFVRIHRGSLVNVKAIQKLELYDKNAYQLILKNGIKLAVSKTGYKELKELLGW